ncbi:SelA-like pyridoxal phosphate-dependent enzyme [Mesoplasma florum]|nr:SelA-like pyridoxal phosphate-dependent enzyme [Mesoplasma florum]
MGSIVKFKMKKQFKKVINANGRMTILGVSKISDNVIEGMKFAGTNFFVMDDFKKQVNDELKKIIKTENLCIVNSASAGISLSVASSIYKDRIYDVNKEIPEKNEIIIPKGHNIDFGAPIENLIYLVGGKVIEAGYSNTCSKSDIEYRISDKTAALVYVVSHHCVQKNMLSLNEMIEIAKNNKIPLIVDCAAEEEIEYYASLNIDAVIFSGSKAIQGPTSGLVFGKNKELIDNLYKHTKVIGRPMKIGKENIYGLLVAIRDYKQNKNLNEKEYLSVFETNEWYESKIVYDERKIPRIRLIFNNKINAKNISNLLKAGEISVYLRDYLANQNILDIDLRNMNEEDSKYIKNQIEEIIKGEMK